MKSGAVNLAPDFKDKGQWNYTHGDVISVGTLLFQLRLLRSSVSSHPGGNKYTKINRDLQGLGEVTCRPDESACLLVKKQTSVTFSFHILTTWLRLSWVEQKDIKIIKSWQLNTDVLTVNPLVPSDIQRKKKRETWQKDFPLRNKYKRRKWLSSSIIWSHSPKVFLWCGCVFLWQRCAV